MNNDSYQDEQVTRLLNYSNAQLEQCAKEGDAMACCVLASKLYTENPEASMMWAQRGLDGGDGTGAFLLGKHFLEGLGVEQDGAVALEYFCKAADMGCNAAKLFAAAVALRETPDKIYEIRNRLVDFELPEDNDDARNMFAGVQRDFVEHLEKMSRGGSAEAIFLLGWCHYCAFHYNLNYGKAASLYGKAAELGYPEAQYEYGLCYLEGKGTEQDLEQAEFWNRQAALQGWPMAEFEEGVYLSSGEAGRTDPKEAFEWFKRGAEHGHPGANAIVGTYYRDGREVEQDLPKAVEYFRRAAELGSPKGYCYLGLSYMNAQGVEFNFFHAAENLSRACMLGWKDAEGPLKALMQDAVRASHEGNADAQFALGIAYMHILPERQPEMAVHWFSMAAENGAPHAKTQLAEYYLDEGRDWRKGLSYLTEAAGEGNPRAMAILGCFKLDGAPGVPKDMTEGKALLIKAKEAGDDLAADQYEIRFNHRQRQDGEYIRFKHRLPE